VGRNEDLRTLRSLLQPSASTLRKVIVLHGLGGIGKTQLAIRFARLHQTDFSAIFWLNGKTKETLLRSLADLLYKLPGVNRTADLKTEDEIEQAARKVLQWLATPNNCRWLLIFDNIDKYSATEQPADERYDVTKFFPSADYGSIIITTRIPQLAEVGQSYPVETLQASEAVTLLSKTAGLTTMITDNLSPILSGRSEFSIIFIQLT
jgi:ATP-dependent protease HslVU (ClpYQ) ATPase subunit